MVSEILGYFFAVRMAARISRSGELPKPKMFHEFLVRHGFVASKAQRQAGGKHKRWRRCWNGLPVNPPLLPMLAKRVDELPSGEDWIFEPKWDGFRALVFRDGDEVLVQSRDEKPLNRYFPELLEPLRSALPPRCVRTVIGTFSTKSSIYPCCNCDTLERVSWKEIS